MHRNEREKPSCELRAGPTDDEHGRSTAAAAAAASATTSFSVFAAAAAAAAAERTSVLQSAVFGWQQGRRSCKKQLAMRGNQDRSGIGKKWVVTKSTSRVGSEPALLLFALQLSNGLMLGGMVFGTRLHIF